MIERLSVSIPPRLSVSIPPVQHSWLRQQADNLGISISEILRRIIDQQRVPKD
jgi:hypothetical protein